MCLWGPFVTVRSRLQPDPAGGVPEWDVLQLRGSIPCTVLGEPHCLFPVSSTGSGILRWAQWGGGPGQACGTVFDVFGTWREQVEDQMKEGGLCCGVSFSVLTPVSGCSFPGFMGRCWALSVSFTCCPSAGSWPSLTAPFSWGTPSSTKVRDLPEVACVGWAGEGPSEAMDPALDLSQHPHVSPVSCVGLCHGT